jgi:hypothetical protein
MESLRPAWALNVFIYLKTKQNTKTKKKPNPKEFYSNGLIDTLALT